MQAEDFQYHARRSGMLSAILIIILTAVPATIHGAPPPVITFQSLLAEMVDRAALASAPEPVYNCRQFSSYDRRSVSPDDQSDEGWFANADAGNYLRVEERGDRREFVMMDAQGPGAIARIWSANPKGTLRIYLDGDESPVLEEPMAVLLSGEGAVPAPVAAIRARGANLYLPIPFANRCIVTTDDGEGMYYQINYRTYEAGAAVESFAADSLSKASKLLEMTAARLTEDQFPVLRPLLTGSHGVLPGRTNVVYENTNGPAAVTTLLLRTNPDLAYGNIDLAEMLRSSVITIEFDGVKTVECPLGDFFGAAPAVAAYASWPITVHDARVMVSRFVMPYRKSLRVSITNHHETEQLWAWVEAETTPLQWTERSMYFHADWKIERDMATRPRRDWNYLEVEGEGVYVGDALSVTNPVEDWWGEGDEKIYVDGEEFPSHFGTGTEDYYGYAWCSPEVFHAPFHNQPRCDGPGNYGHTSVNRFRGLDAIPFRGSLKVDMEVWHWRECAISYAVTTYWYGKPGAKSKTPAITADMVRMVPVAPPLPPPFKIDGAIEAEDLAVVAKSGDFPAGRQELWKENTFSGDAHLWVQATKPGDWIELEVPLPKPGRYQIVLHFTKSWDYGMVQPFINTVKAGDLIDLFNTDARDIAASGAINLGTFALDGVSVILRLEVSGSNAAVDGLGTFFGVDCIEVTEVRNPHP
jgi:hypothetical protein